MDLVWIVPLGLVVGVVVGSLGGGGAIITVPILVYLLHQDPSAATTGSLIIVALTSLVGMIPHRRAGRVRIKDGLLLGGLGVVGSFAGSALNHAVPAPVLMTAFAALLFVVAALMTRKRRRAASDAASGITREAGERRGLPALIAAATGVGLLTGFFGVGGGFAVVPALVLVLGFTMPVAVGTSLLVIVVNSITALAARAGVGLEVDWSVILPFSVFGAAGSLLGAKVAQKVDEQKLNLGFTILLVAVACFVAYENVPDLLHLLR